ncbi:XdhC family protein [Acetobacteraceae bacterium]|nr:XdhC family protein [Acetobacteraceae bacterium]
MEKMSPQSLKKIHPKAALLTDRPTEIFTFILEAFEAQQKCTLISLVDIIQGSSRALGAHMAVREDGLYCGFVSGGCVENAVAQEALTAISENKDRFCHFGKGSPHFDIVLPCGGGIKLAIHLLKDAKPITEILSFLRQRKSCFLTYHPQEKSLTATYGKEKSGWTGNHFYIAYRPATRLFLSGGAYETEILAEIADSAGFEVSHPATNTPNEILRHLEDWTDENTAIALLHHDPERELPILEKALKTKAFYIGCLGSVQTHERRKKHLMNKGFSSQKIAKIHAPIGLFGPARNARPLAVSIVAEIMKSADNYSLP